jgi:hypothetical protein
MEYKRYLNFTEAGKVYNCERVSVRAAASKPQLLQPAIVEHNGKRLVDMEHPAARAYRLEHRVTNPDAPSRVIPTSGPMTDDPTVGAEIRAVWKWTIEDVFTKCGSLPAFSSLLQSIDKIESIHAKRLAADKSTGELISREYVSKHVLGLIERMFQRLLTDLPVGLSYEVHGKCATGATVEAIQESIRTAVTRELKSVKADTRKAIRNASS